MSEIAVVAKVEELMRTLDQVKKYKALARLMGDFLVIILLSFIALFSLELIFNFYYLTGNFQSYFSYPNILWVVTPSTGFGFSSTSLLALIIIAGGIIVGFFWVEHKLKRVKVEQWKSTLNEGFAGAVRLLQELNWDTVFDDIRASAYAYGLYALLKVAVYWIFVMIILAYPYLIVLGLIHTDYNPYLLAFISLALVFAFSKKDLQKKYRQIVSLDSLLWELRWFNSEFKSAEFKT
jgi:hypothetical protein